MRPEESRSFDSQKEVRLDDPEQARFWTEHLAASEAEIADAIAKVGCNRTAVELYLGSYEQAPEAAVRGDALR